jgi:hypothetical protein
MAHARSFDNGAPNLHWLRCVRSAAVVLLGCLVTDPAAYAQTLTLRHPRDLLASAPEAFAAWLETARPAPVTREDMRNILRELPPKGEVTELEYQAQAKVNAVRQLLTATRRDWYEVKVIDLPQAVVALHARAVILISAPAVALLSGAELRALAAHEIGHEYVWGEWERAHQHADQERLKELELVCDAIATVTLHHLGRDPAVLVDAIEKLSRSNRDRFGTATHEKNYPALAERRAFVRAIAQWLRGRSSRNLRDSWN